MLQMKSVNKNFRDFHVLKNIDITAKKGEIYGLVGSNGCGKTTLLKQIMQIYKQDNGDIQYNNHTLVQDDVAFGDFYFVQDDLFFPYGSTLKSLYDYEKLFYKNMSEEKFYSLAEYFTVDINKKLSNMSKGQKKQAAFVLAMASCPEVLLLDEIVDGLDAVVRRKFWNVLFKEVSERDMIVLISSHDLKELDNISDRVGIMHNGEIIKEESMESLKEDLKRVQFAIDKDYEEVSGEKYTIIKVVQIGSVYFATIKGSVDAFRNDLENRYKILLFDELAINLEEIFITELGGTGYGTEELKEQ